MTKKNNKDMIIGVVAVILVIVLLGSFGFGGRNSGLNISGAFNLIVTILWIILLVIIIVFLYNNREVILRRLK